MRNRSIVLSLVFVLLLLTASPAAAVPREHYQPRFERPFERIVNVFKRLVRVISDSDGMIPPIPNPEDSDP